MSTENYKLSDLMNTTDGMTFDSDATNLVVDKKNASYLNDEDIRSKLSYTQIKDAKVEYFLSRWTVNDQGCIMKVQQSKSFVLKGKF
jgi:hypothetical protein